MDYFDSIIENELSSINMGNFDSQKNKKVLAKTDAWFSCIGIPICLHGSSCCLLQTSNIVLFVIKILLFDQDQKAFALRPSLAPT